MKRRDYFPARTLIHQYQDLSRGTSFGTRMDGRRYPKHTSRSNILSYANRLARSGWIFVSARKAHGLHVELWRRRGQRIHVYYDDTTERVIKVEAA